MFKNIGRREIAVVGPPLFLLLLIGAAVSSQPKPAAAQYVYYIQNHSCGYGQGCQAYGTAGPGGIIAIGHGVGPNGPVSTAPGGAYCSAPPGSYCPLTVTLPETPNVAWFTIEVRSDSYAFLGSHVCFGGPPQPQRPEGISATLGVPVPTVTVGPATPRR